MRLALEDEHGQAAARRAERDELGDLGRREEVARRGEAAAATEDWATATEVYKWLVAQDPEDSRWKDALAQAQREQQLEARYTAGLGAVEQEQWDLAQRALADVVRQQPDYKEASRYL